MKIKRVNQVKIGFTKPGAAQDQINFLAMIFVLKNGWKRGELATTSIATCGIVQWTNKG